MVLAFLIIFWAHNNNIIIIIISHQSPSRHSTLTPFLLLLRDVPNVLGFLYNNNVSLQPCHSTTSSPQQQQQQQQTTQPILDTSTSPTSSTQLCLFKRFRNRRKNKNSNGNESIENTVILNKSNDNTPQQQQQQQDNSTIVEDDMENFFHDSDEGGDIPKNRLITVSGQMMLPFSIQVAYDAYSNLPRQPTWSSWLDSVVISPDNPKESIWTMKIWGIKYSWTAVAVQNISPYLIQWRSITGLQNYGTVRFYENNNNNKMKKEKVMQH